MQSGSADVYNRLDPIDWQLCHSNLQIKPLIMQYVHYTHFSSQHGYPNLRIRGWNVNSNLPLVFQSHFPYYQIIVDELVAIPEL